MRSTDRHRLLVTIALLALGAGLLAALAAPRTPTSGPGSSTTGATTPSSSTTAPPSTPTSTEPTTSSTTSPSTTLAAWSGTAQAVWRGSGSARVVALTFDAGSDVGYAAAILDTLRANDVSASFGITGAWASAHPELVRRMADEGHQLLNHSYDHPSFTGRSTDTAPLGRAERLDQLARTEALVEAAAGQAARPWFRPPYGDEDATVRADVGSAGYRYEAMWTVDSLGWKGLAAEEIVARCLERAEPGAIYLFHVGSASADAVALQAILDGLGAQGYGFVTLAQLVDR